MLSAAGRQGGHDRESAEKHEGRAPHQCEAAKLPNRESLLGFTIDSSASSALHSSWT